ncbi:hypothetical protein Tco_0868939 [Tanacetum coccineum]
MHWVLQLRRLNLKRHDASIDLSPPHESLTQFVSFPHTTQPLNPLYGQPHNVPSTRFEGRNELLEKIIGYVVDSGGVPELDPKVLDIWGLFGIA